MVRSTLPTGKTRYPFYRRLGGPQDRSGRMSVLWCINIQETNSSKTRCLVDIHVRSNVELGIYIYRVSQEECARLREGVPYVKVYRYNPKHLCQSRTVTEIMAREVLNFASCYTLIDYQIHIKTGRNM